MIAEKATDREVVKAEDGKVVKAEDGKESGGITADEFEPFWSQMPKAEEEKDPTKRKGTGAISGGMSDPIDFDSA